MDSKVHSVNGAAAETELPATAAVETEQTVEAEAAPKKEAEPVADHPTGTEFAPAAETTIPEKVHSPMASKVHSGNGTAAGTPETETESEIPATAVEVAPEKEVKPVVDRPAPAAETTVPKKERRGWPVDCLFRVIVPALKAESIIGRNGDLIKKMCQETKAHISVLEGPVWHPDRIVLISGKEDTEAPLSPAMDGVIRVFKCVNGFPENESDGVTSIPFCSIRLLLTSIQAMSLIGKQGSSVNTIQENIGCSVRILPSDEVSTLSANSDDRVVDLKGEALKVLQALEAVLGHLRMLLNNARSTLEKHQVGIQVTQRIPISIRNAVDIIGVGGKNIANIGRMSGAILTVQERKGLHNEIAVVIKGTSPQVKTARQLLLIQVKTIKDRGRPAVPNMRTVHTPDRTTTLSLSPPLHVTAAQSGTESIKEPKRIRVSWNINVVKTFLDACIHEITINGQENGSLKAMSWKKVREMLKDRHNFSVDSKQMKNYFAGLKTKYKAWLILKSKIDNSYDPSTNTFNLTDNEWETEIKKNKCIETVRDAPLPFPNLCAQLFGSAISTSMGIRGWGLGFAKHIPETNIQKDTISLASPSSYNPPIKNKQKDSLFSSSGLPCFGFYPGLSTKCPPGFDCTAGPFVTQAKTVPDGAFSDLTTPSSSLLGFAFASSSSSSTPFSIPSSTIGFSAASVFSGSGLFGSSSSSSSSAISLFGSTSILGTSSIFGASSISTTSTTTAFSWPFSSGLIGSSSSPTPSFTTTTMNPASKTMSFPAFGVTSSSSTTNATGSVPQFANPTTTTTGKSSSFLGFQTSSKTVAATTPQSTAASSLCALPLPATETTKKEPMVEVPPELPQVQPATACMTVETKRTMSVFEEEILGVLKMIADNINKPEPPPKPTFDDCEKKLNELGWPKDDPLHEVAYAIFCDENDKYRECWMKLDPERCVKWVRMIGRSKSFL